MGDHDDELPELPAGFLMGASTAAHQTEGGNVNADLWDVEHAPGTIFVEPSGDACDSYHRYADDITLLAEAGLDTYRYGIEWSRIEPAQGEFSLAALDHYRRMAATCRDHDVTPVLTYQHFTAPKWFAWNGGWSADDAADLFGRYAERVAAHLGDIVDWACTINESNLMASVLQAGFAPVSDESSAEQLADGAAEEQPAEGAGEPLPLPPMGGFPSADLEVMARAHRRAVEAIKSGPGDPKVGWSLALVDFQGVDGGEERAARARQVAQLDWLDASAGDDFVGVQTYSRERFGPDGRLPVPKGASTMQTGWEAYPEALEHTIRLAAAGARVPVLVTENGMATEDDAARIAYTANALRGVQRCLDDGVDVRGYLHWSLLDNFEWMSGYAKTFGLIAVDRTTFTRHPKPSLAWFGRVARARSAA